MRQHEEEKRTSRLARQKKLERFQVWLEDPILIQRWLESEDSVYLDAGVSKEEDELLAETIAVYRMQATTRPYVAYHETVR